MSYVAAALTIVNIQGLTCAGFWAFSAGNEEYSN